MDRVALVTGAARGIGLATTELFNEQGWRVIMVDCDGPALAEACDGAAQYAISCDVSDPDAVDAMMAEASGHWGRIDAVVNNAGVADFGPIEETTFARWKRVMQTNLDGPFLVTQAAIPHLKAAKGAIVNIASISGLMRASTLRVAYGTSKAAVIQLTLQQAAELGEYGIRANAVAPGPVRTKLAMAVHSPEIIAAYHDGLPLNRYGSEREIAEAICFLCSKRASFITGQCLAADGGFQGTGIGLPALRAEAALDGETPDED